TLRDEDEADPANVGAKESALVATGADRSQQALVLVEPDGGDGDAGPRGKLADRNDIVLGDRPTRVHALHSSLDLKFSSGRIHAKRVHSPAPKCGKMCSENRPQMNERAFMPQGTMEHANLAVSDIDRLSVLLQSLLGWQVRWRGPAMSGGETIHVGTGDVYIALYTNPQVKARGPVKLGFPLNHIGLQV